MPTAPAQRSDNQVRIPPELNAKLDTFFSTLKMQVLNSAVQAAADRTSSNGPLILQAEDLLNAAQDALGRSAGELTRVLSSHEPIRTRRAS